MPRPTVSIAVIAKNEENNVRQWFKSIEGLFDQYIFVDTGSTDQTVAIAKGLGCEIHHFEWINDFSAARNFAFSKVTSDFVFWCDLDDVLDGREEFINFRDHVMGLADYWLATYHYASDDKGNPVCSFARERVFRMSKQMTWNYPIHEGVRPMSSFGDVRAQYCPTWTIVHKRTAEDLSKDRMRNLSIFEKIKKTGKLCHRLRYYYGKELFEAGKFIEATQELGSVLSEEGLEMHDRILAYQFCCYAYMQLADRLKDNAYWQKTIDLAHCGIQIAPHRAEFHNMIADCHIKLGQMQNAIPYFKAAQGCTTFTPPGHASAIFHQQDAYTSYPRNQLARILANSGDWDGAIAQAQESAWYYNNPESRMLVEEISKIKKQMTGYDKAKPCEDIVLTTPPNAPYEWDGEIAKNKSMGGSETAAIEMMTWIAKLSGRKVIIFNVRQDTKTVDGIEYRPVHTVHEYFAQNKPFLHIAWRHNNKLTDAKTFLWAHDLQTPGAEKHENYERMLCLTPFHKTYAMGTQGIPESKIYVTRNGIKPERFMDGPWEKNPNKIVFPSSPDRGLDRAMRVLDKVRDFYPDLELHVFYGIEHLPKYGLTDLMNRLRAMMDERPWVKYHGATQQDELMRHLKESALWLHPCDWIETSCITAMEMVCSGVYPVTRRLGGLADTLALPEALNMAVLLDHDCVTEKEYSAYIDATIHALNEQAWKRVNFDADTVSWELVAEQWLKDLPEIAYGKLIPQEGLNHGSVA